MASYYSHPGSIAHQQPPTLPQYTAWSAQTRTAPPAQSPQQPPPQQAGAYRYPYPTDTQSVSQPPAARPAYPPPPGDASAAGQLNPYGQSSSDQAAPLPTGTSPWGPGPQDAHPPEHMGMNGTAAAPPGARTRFMGGAGTYSGGVDGRVIEEADILQYNAYPQFIQASSSKLPGSASVKQTAAVPFGLIVQPLARTNVEVPTVNFGSGAKIVRCQRCRTYINPFVKWEAGGRRWICNICDSSNDTPNNYSPGLDEYGNRVDRADHPELYKGSVDFVAPSDYMLRPPQPPVFMFVINVSQPAITSGMVAAVCQGIKAALESEELTGGSRTLVGILTYDSAVHFYDLEASRTQARIAVVPDLEDMFLPLPDGILVNARDSKDLILGLLDSLPTMWDNRNKRDKQVVIDNCLGSAIRGAFMAMRHLGGRMMVFASNSPTVGSWIHPGNRAEMMQVKKQPADAGEREVELLKPFHDEYTAFAGQAAPVQVAVELFACPPTAQSMDLATMLPMVKSTGGEMHYYPVFNAASQGDKLRREVTHSLTRIYGWESVMRIRVSRGWKISKWFGNYQFRGADLLVLPNCHEDQSFSITLDLEDNVAPSPLVYVQAALLLTSSDGERRIRVHTFCYQTCQNFNDLIPAVEAGPTAYLMAQVAVNTAQKGTVADGRNQLLGWISSALLAGNPSNLQAVPCYVLGLSKSIALREPKDVTSDLRIFHWSRLCMMPVSTALSYFYPSLYPIHDLGNNYGEYDGNQQVIMPSTTTLNNTALVSGTAYLLCDGVQILMWLHRAVSPQWIHAVFGVPSVDQLHPDYCEAALGASGDPIGRRVASIIEGIRQTHKPPYLKLVLCRTGEITEYEFFASMVEERTPYGQTVMQELLQKMCPRVGGAGGGSAGVPAGGARVASHYSTPPPYAAGAPQSAAPYGSPNHPQYPAASPAVGVYGQAPYPNAQPPASGSVGYGHPQMVHPYPQNSQYPATMPRY